MSNSEVLLTLAKLIEDSESDSVKRALKAAYADIFTGRDSEPNRQNR